MNKINDRKVFEKSNNIHKLFCILSLSYCFCEIFNFIFQENTSIKILLQVNIILIFFSSIFIICENWTRSGLLLKTFIVITMLPVLRYDFESEILGFVDRVRWLFFIASILIANYDCFFLIKRCLWIGAVSVFIFVIFFPSVFFNLRGDAVYEIQRIPSYLLLGSGLLLCLPNVINRSQRIFLYMVFIIISCIYIFFARRSGAVHLLLIMIAPIIIKLKLEAKYLISLLCILLGTYILFELLNNYLGGTLFTEMMSRLTDDSRSIVNEEACIALNNSDFGWYFGLGVQGGYENPLFWEDIDIRTNIETGVLDVILDGGILLWIVLMLLSIKAIVNGLRSHLLEYKAMSYYIFLYVLLQYPLPQPLLGLYSLSIFYAIGKCLFIPLEEKSIFLNSSNYITPIHENNI